MTSIENLDRSSRSLSWYTCGPTIYNHSHLGHARTFTTVDLAIRTLRSLGKPILHLMNITDIDDKILHKLIKASFHKWLETAEGRLFAKEHDDIKLQDVSIEWIQTHAIEMPPVSMVDYEEFIGEMEGEFWTDMQALGNERPDLILRVSDVIPEIVDYIQVIMKNGYAYEADGSVYLDMEAFDKAEGFAPLPFAPKSSGFDTTLDKSKKGPRDFSLWNKP